MADTLAIRKKLGTAMLRYDETQRGKTGYNPHALGLMLFRLDDVMAEIGNGTSIARALYDNYTGRLLTALERVADVPVTYGGGGHDKGRPA